jgi:2-phospho-L-lactate transferase/gluconeogenesis factor (CofD/UPF0052 family)
MSAPSPIRIVLFCGGRGSATIIRALLRHTEIELTLIVNAYDDGLSTGALRDFIPGMLGPSDFRKNLSYLLGNYSDAQYALKSLMEYRLPAMADSGAIEKLSRFSQTNNLTLLETPIKDWFAQLPPLLSARLRSLLVRFFAHAAAADTKFDYRDCSLGNLVFAGAYLQHDKDFNRAAADIGDLVGSRARLFNVSSEKNCVLVGLKQDGTLLPREANIVGPQSTVPITNLYFLPQPPTDVELAALNALDVQGRRQYLAARQTVPKVSEAAALALAEADIIFYGPGTQHSSLLPSYRIAADALTTSPAPVKALVMNLQSDNDIQGLSASDVTDRVLAYGAPVSDILIDDGEAGLSRGALTADTYRGAAVSRGSYATPFRPGIHNGGAVAERVLALYAGADAGATSVEIFVDIHNRSAASDELVEEFLETDWGHAPAHLTLNRVALDDVAVLPVATVHLGGLFPETGYFHDWLRNGTSNYLVLMTGDGAYRFRDVQAIIRLLERQPSLGGVFGSRTQSRRQFITSIQAAYGENRLLYVLGKAAAFFLSILFYLRTGIIFSDPLTGLRVFRRQRLRHLSDDTALAGNTPLAIVRLLIRHGVEVAELPVLYRTFSGFTDSNWRMRRGMRNLFSLLS